METTKSTIPDLPLKPIEQKLDFTCGPIALLIALRYQYGLKLTQGEIEFITGVTKGGADEYNLIRALDLLGFKFHMSSTGTLDELKKCLENGQAPIVHLVMQDGGGHYMVVKKIDDENIHLADPATGKIVTYGIFFFLGVWKEEEKNTVTHWYLVCTGDSGIDKIDGVVRKWRRIQKKVKTIRR